MLFIDSYIVLSLQEANCALEKVIACISQTLILDVKLKMNNHKIEFVIISSPTPWVFPAHFISGIGNSIILFSDDVRLLSQYEKYFEDETMERKGRHFLESQKYMCSRF